MPITYKQLQSGEPLEVEVHYRGETFNVFYVPEKVTPSLQRKLQGVADDPMLLVDYMTAFITDWDGVLDENGKKVPLTGEALAELGFEVLQAINEAIGEDMKAGKRPKRLS